MKGFKNILAVVDLGAETHAALAEAVQLAEHNQAKLTIVDVVPEFGWPVRLSLPDHEHIRQLMAKEKEEQLAALADPIREHGIQVASKVLLGRESTEIVREALRTGNDLVVSCISEKHAAYHGRIDKTNMQILRTCPCAVWMLHPDRPPRCRRLLAAVDPSPDDDAHAELNARIMEAAIAISEKENAQLLVAHAWQMSADDVSGPIWSPTDFEEMERPAAAKVEDQFNRFLSPYGMKAGDGRAVLVKGSPDPEIARLADAHDVDLIVMGTIGNAGLAGILMGNTAERILGEIDCAVLALKPRGFICPVKL